MCGPLMRSTRMPRNLLTNEDGGVKPGVKYAGIGLLVVILGYWAFTTWTGGDRALTATLMCYTQGCGYTTARELEIGEVLPATCPKCGNKSVVSAFKCPGCGTPNVWNEDRGLAPPTRCTKCGREVRYGQ